MSPRGSTRISEHYQPAVLTAWRRRSNPANDLWLPLLPPTRSSAPLQNTGCALVYVCLPALAAAGAALHVAAAQAGLMMSLFMLGFAITPLFYGPASDGYGRKPVVLFACTLFIAAGIACAPARSPPTLLAWRFVQGAGAGASVTIALAIIRDLFEGAVARTKISQIAIATMGVPTLAPTAGAALRGISGWRAIHAVLAVVGALLLLVMLLGFAESAPMGRAVRLAPSVVARNYLRVLRHLLCLRYILVNAAAFGALFAHVSGSSLFLINVVGLQPTQYGLIFAATSLGIMGGACLNGRLNARGVPPGYPLAIGLGVAAASTMLLLLAMTLAAWMPLPVVVSLLILATAAFGLVAPNAMEGAMEPLPQIAGAATGCYPDGDGSRRQLAGRCDLRRAFGALDDRAHGVLLAARAIGPVHWRPRPGPRH